MQSCLTLCDPRDCSLPGSSVHGILQARILEWVAISFSRGSSWTSDRTQVSFIAGRFFTIWAMECFTLIEEINTICEGVHLCFRFYPILVFFLVKEMETHSSTLAWRILWTEELSRLQSMGSLRVGHYWVTLLSCIGEGNGNPLPCSCLENPRDGGAWWAATYGVTQSRVWLKRLSSSSSLFLLGTWVFFGNPSVHK